VAKKSSDYEKSKKQGRSNHYGNDKGEEGRKQENPYAPQPS
jgi:hypothetical protein